MKKDFKSKKLSKNEEEIVKRLLGYFDDRMLNLVAQFRGLAIAANITPEHFFQSFVDESKQKVFFDRLHAEEDRYNKQEQEKSDQLRKINEFQTPQTNPDENSELQQSEGVATPGQTNPGDGSSAVQETPQP